MVTLVSWINHLFPYKLITVLLTIVLCCILYPLWLVYFITESLYLLILFTYFAKPFSLFPSPLAITSLLSMYVSLFSFCFVYLFCFLDSTYKWDGTAICLCVYISLSAVPSGSIHVVTNCKLWSSFYMLDTVRHHMLWYLSVIWQ